MTRTTPATLFAALLLARAASAADAPVPSDSEEPAVRADTPLPSTGYHLQMLAVDAASVASALTGFAIEGDHQYNPRVSEVLRGAGMGGYALGGPIVHLAHRQYGRAGISLALRVGLPILGAAVGAWSATCHPDEWFCGVGEAVAGFAIGSAAAIGIDNAFVVPSAGPSTVDPGPVAATAHPSAGLRLAPRLVATPNVAVLGAGGQF
jgi:hypothetical protein